MELVVLLLIATAVAVVIDVLAASMILTPWLVLLVLLALLTMLFKIPVNDPGLSMQGVDQGDRPSPSPSAPSAASNPPAERTAHAPQPHDAIAPLDGEADQELTYRGARYHHPVQPDSQVPDQQVEQVCMYRGKVYKTFTCTPSPAPEHPAH